jgi:thermospermine synthase
LESYSFRPIRPILVDCSFPGDITIHLKMTENTKEGRAIAIAAERAKAGFQFREEMAPGLIVEMELKKILYSSQSEFQQIDVIETYFGKTLITDGKTQSAQSDEFAYHESLVHPPLFNFVHFSGKGPKTVFIGGGGELATAREVLRHKSVERLVMVDLDEKVVECSIQHLPEWGGEAVKSDPRLELIIGDAHAYMVNCKETFDVIIMDISDPIEAGPGIALYTKELYQHAQTLLNPHGVFVTQSGIAEAVPAPHCDGGDNDTTCFGPIRNTLGEVFDCVAPYSQSIPSYGSDWGFVMAFQAPSNMKDKAQQVVKEWQIISEDKVDGYIESNITGGEAALKLYDGTSHIGMFALTKALRKHLSVDKRVMTKDSPVFMY